VSHESYYKQLTENTEAYCTRLT